MPKTHEDNTQHDKITVQSPSPASTNLIAKKSVSRYLSVTPSFMSNLFFSTFSLHKVLLWYIGLR